jgi:TusA-related sulfurtransferase
MSTTESATARVLLDNRRTPCAVGLIKAARTMKDLPAGTVLEIWSRDRFAPMEIPIWASRDGHRLLRRGRGGRWPRRHFVFEVHKDSGAKA